MLPGFRFLFAAIMLSMSILVFGLGAAALLRAAHEEVASNPAWHAAPEVTFAQQPEATRPVLAMLRVDTPSAEAQDNAPVTAVPAEQVAIAPPATEAERVAVLKPDDSPPAEMAKTEIAPPEVPVAENPVGGELAPASAKTPASAEDIKFTATATEQIREDQPVAALPEQTGLPVTSGTAIAAMKVATLGGAPVNIESPQQPKALVVAAKPEQSEIRKQQQAKRAAHRRRLAARAQLAAQAAQQSALPVNPFLPPAPTARTR
ncbi:MAG TPA: hypothetical protein VE111_22890 [Bradyrhizobium sp.]|nr:hypothetical protein [Bradyrhizobium sp.]